jgi:peptidoglycan/LPS O-acetylase OafA/YrhL
LVSGQRPEDGYIPSLDGLRAAAVAAVMVHHAFAAGSPALLQPLVQMGWVGVDLFFVLSGFLITRILLQARESPGYFRGFYTRRALRILPAYALILALAALAGPWLEGVAWPGIRWPLYLLFVQNFARSEGVGPVLGPTWSLAIEEQFYLLWPLVVRRAGRGQLYVLLIAVLALAPGVRLLASLGGEGAFVKTPFRLDGLAAGALLALVATDARLEVARLRSWSRRLMLFVLAPALLGLMIFAARPASTSLLAHAFLVVRYSGLALGFAGLVGAALVPGMVPGALAWAPVRYVGRISYSIYLQHMAVLLLVGKLAPPSWLGRSVAIGLRFLIACAVVLGTASLSWFLLERPTLALKDRLAPARSRSRAGPAD